MFITLSKSTAVSLSLMALSSVALADVQKKFAHCYGDHHGSYLDFFSHSQDAQGGSVTGVTISVTGDADDVPAKLYRVVRMTKNGETLQPKAYSWAIRQAIQAEAVGGWYGFIQIDARSASGSVMSVNLQKYTGELRHALVIDGYVEELTCPADLINN